ncbi:MAG: hypothetical protein EKK42_20405 [Pseudonocardiaceae bacterium]|nr:MAG: hypothetical protein EKK42_20405 [Pseudonocardiaceae bacterium]
MAALVTPEDVGIRLGVEYEEPELSQVAALCDDVSELIRARRPLIDQWITDGYLSAGTVVAVAVQVVARALTSVNTGGVGIRSEQHPEYSYELTSSTAAGLNLSNREIAMLTPPRFRNRPFSIFPY